MDNHNEDKLTRIFDIIDIENEEQIKQSMEIISSVLISLFIVGKKQYYNSEAKEHGVSIKINNSNYNERNILL